MSISPKPVGLLMCQTKPYLKDFVTRVIECSPSATEQNLYEVILEDTILFPEGGGQPSDLGFINNIPVSKVLRRGLSAVHILDSPLDVGKKVNLSLDYERRFDHMQQHSGQHLLSAILENEYKFDTVSWELGKLKCFVELKAESGAKLTDEIVAEVEKICNNAIIDAINVSVVTTDMADIERPESLPEDYQGGVIRHIVIDGIDNNPCCGTHVTNLSQLQSLKLGQPETGRKGTIRLPFLVGLRVLKYLDSTMRTERKLNVLLSTNPEEHTEAVDRLLKQQRENNKINRNLLKEIASFTANNITSQLKTDTKIATLHREDGNLDFVFNIASIVHPIIDSFSSSKDTPISRAVVVSAGPKKIGGPIAVFGDPDLVASAVETLKKYIPTIKGGGKSSRWQGKSDTWVGLKQAFDSIQSYYNLA